MSMFGSMWLGEEKVMTTVAEHASRREKALGARDARDARDAGDARRNQEALIQGRKALLVAVGAIAGIAMHLLLRFAIGATPLVHDLPLFVVLGVGGTALVIELVGRLVRREFGSDLLAGISIVTAVFLGEYLAGALVVLMLSGGQALEQYAVRRASSALDALARRMPSVAHRKHGERGERVEDVPIDDIVVGDMLLIYPHETCPVDGEVVAGSGTMDESYLTGEWLQVPKARGSAVLSGATNGEEALSVRASHLAADSRYAKIMQVMRDSEQDRPRLRRLGDQLGAIYTPVALVAAAIAWGVSGEAERFLAVLVVATPCPLLIAIPVAIIGAISVSAKRTIVVKNPAALEHANSCQTVIFDKTGTLTYGEPKLDEQICSPDFDRRRVLEWVASLERYSKHPLARAIVAAAEQEGIAVQQASEIREPPGQGLRGIIAEHEVQVTSRGKLAAHLVSGADALPSPPGSGPECVIAIDGQYAAVYRFHDEPRADSAAFVSDLANEHGVQQTLIVSGDREGAVRHLASEVGIDHILAEQSPEQKLAAVRQETQNGKTLYIGDGINDAPALTAATVGVAMGQHSEVTSEAADVVVMENSLTKVDEFLHISRRMRRVALQSAVGGMVLSLVGMALAGAGYLPPVFGALTQELIDVLAVANALRAAFLPARMTSCLAVTRQSALGHPRSGAKAGCDAA